MTSHLTKTAHPHINRMLALFLSEKQPFRKIHRMIDVFETIIKTHTAVIVSNYFEGKKLSEGIKGLLAEGLRVPSLGVWQMFSREIVKEMRADKQPAFIEGFYSYFEKWDKTYFSGKRDVVTLRNAYAHGATPSNSACEHDIASFEPVLSAMLQAEWLQNTTIAAFKSVEEQWEVVLTDGEEPSLPGTDLSSFLKGAKDITEHHCYLLDSSGKRLDLFPLIVLKQIEYEGQMSNVLTFFNDLKRRQSVSLLHYPYSLHIKDKELYAEFTTIFPVAQWRSKTSTEFKERIEELTEVFKGRQDERSSLLDFVSSKEKGFYFLYGSPGIGKSALLAQVLKDIAKEHLRASGGSPKLSVIEYFIRRGTIHARPETFLAYINRRIEERFKTGIPFGGTVDEMRNSLHERLSEVSRRIDDEKLVLMVDGLDEGGNETRSILDYMIRETYRNVLLVLGTRKTDSTERFYNDTPPEHKVSYELQGLGLNDIRSLLYDVADKYRIQNKYVDAIAKKSQGNPLYLKMLCLALEEGSLALNNEVVLPPRINNFYEGFIERFSGHADGDAILAGLYLFGAARDYLTQADLEHFLQIGKAKSERVIYALQEVLVENPEGERGGFQLFHESFRTFLWQEKKGSLIEVEKKIASLCGKWQTLKNPQVQKYALLHYSHHLLNLGDSKTLFDLAEDEAYVNTQIATTRQYDASFALYRDAMRCATEKKDTYRIVELAVRIGRLHIRINGSLDEILEWARQGGKDNVKRALARIASFKPQDAFILYCDLLYFTLFETKAGKEVRKKSVSAILEHLDDHLPGDLNMFDWAEFMPIHYALGLLLEIHNLGLETESLIGRSRPIAYYEYNDICSSNPKFATTKARLLMVELVEDSHEEQSPMVKTKNDALGEICNQLMSVGDLQGALQVAKSIPAPQTRARILKEIYLAFAETGAISEANALLEELLEEGDTWTAVVSLIGMSAILRDKNKLELARQSIQRAAQIAEKTNSHSILRLVSNALLTHGLKKTSRELLDRAITIAQESKTTKDRDSALGSCIANLVEQGAFDKALALIEEIVNDYERKMSLRKIIEGISTQGDTSMALVLTEKIVDSSEKDFLLAGLARLKLQKERIKEAVSIIEKMSEETQRAAMAIELSRAGVDEEAQNILSTLTAPEDRFDVLVAMFESLIKRGEKHEAADIVDEIFKISVKDDTISLESFCCDLVRVGFTDKVLRLLEVVDVARKEDILFDVMPSLAEIGKLDQALELSGQIDNDLRKDAVSQILSKLLEKGDYEGAAKVIEMSNWAYTSDVEELVKFGQQDLALLYAEKAVDDEKFKALIVIAMDLVRQNELAEARQLLLDGIAAHESEQDSWHVEDLFAVSAILVDCGDFEKADYIVRTVLEELKPSSIIGDNARSLQKVVVALAKQGDFVKALELADNQAEHRAQAYSAVGAEVVKSGKLPDEVNTKIHLSNCCSIFANEYAKAEHLDEASRIMHGTIMISSKLTAKDRWARDHDLSDLAAQIAKSGAVDRAVKAAEKIDSHLLRDRCLKEISEYLAREGRLAEASRVIQKISDKGLQAEGLAVHYSQLEKSGKNKKASDVLQQIRTILIDSADNKDLSSAKSQVAEYFAENGYAKYAIEFAILMPKSTDRDTVLTGLFRKFLEQDFLLEAEEVTKHLLVDGRARVACLLKLSRKLTSEPGNQNIFEILERAESSAHEISSLWHKSTMIAEVAVEWICLKETARAKNLIDVAVQTAKQIKSKKNEGDSALLLRNIAILLAEASQYDWALKVVEDIGFSARTYALEVILPRLVAQGEFGKAMDLARAELKRFHWEPMLAIALEFDRLGQPENAEECFSELAAYDGWMGILRNHRLKEISTTLAQKGFADKARRFVGLIDEQQYQIAANQEIDNVLKRNETPSRESISATLQRYNKAEDFDSAMEVVNGISDDYERLTAAEQLVRQLAVLGDTQHFSRVLRAFHSTKERIDLIAKLVGEFDETHLGDLWQFITSKIESSQLKLAAYDAFIKKLEKDYRRFPEWVPLLITEVCDNEDVLARCLEMYTMYLRFMDDRDMGRAAKLLRRVNEVIDVQDWLAEDVENYSYDNWEEWVGTVEDDDDRMQVALWAKRVRKGKMTKRDFEDKVKGLLGLT